MVKMASPESMPMKAAPGRRTPKGCMSKPIFVSEKLNSKNMFAPLRLICYYQQTYA